MRGLSKHWVRRSLRTEPHDWLVKPLEETYSSGLAIDLASRLFMKITS